MKYLVNNDSPSDVTLKIYKNNHQPAKTDTLSDYTEATDPSYAPVTLTPSLWTLTSVSNLAIASFPKVSFTFSTTDLICGCYAVNDSGLLWAEKFDNGPHRFRGGSGVVVFEPLLMLD